MHDSQLAQACPRRLTRVMACLEPQHDWDAHGHEQPGGTVQVGISCIPLSGGGGAWQGKPSLVHASSRQDRPQAAGRLAVAGSSRAARSGGIGLSNRFTDLRNSSSASRLSQALALLQNRDIKCALEEAQRGWSQN